MSADHHEGMLIAETREPGKVTWVWILEKGERYARPFRRHDIGLPLDRFKLTGAHRDEIASWVGAATRC